jgi:predicted nucleotidyltransferase component of viral defense system
MYRLMTIMGRIRQVPELSDRLALKGGTAIQGLIFGFKRLSVDIDFNYIGSIEKEQMQKDREEIRKILILLFRDMGYAINQPPITYADEQFYLHFKNIGGGKDKLKLEINYLERLPVTGTKIGIIKHPFDDLGKLEVLSYEKEELYAGKIRALIVRSTPRDLYDANLIASSKHTYEKNLWRKVTIFYLTMQSIDVRKLNTDTINGWTETDIANQLIPMLPQQEKVNLGRMKDCVIPRVKDLLNFSESELNFLNRFYSDHVIDQNVLFKDVSVQNRLDSHPSLIWRLHQIRGME